MKSIGYCETKGISSFTTDQGLAATIQLLERNYSKVVKDAQAEVEPISMYNNLSKLDNLVFSEYINPSALNDISPRKILKIRTKSWGKAKEGKSQFVDHLRTIALENNDSEKFIEACKQEIDVYLKKCVDFEHESDKLQIRILCNLGAIVSGAGSPSLLGQLIAAPSISLMVAIGSTIAFIYGEKRLPEILDLMKQQEELKELRGYSLFRPYSKFS
jgi:hypothetical protein